MEGDMEKKRKKKREKNRESAMRRVRQKKKKIKNMDKEIKGRSNRSPCVCQEDPHLRENLLADVLEGRLSLLEPHGPSIATKGMLC